MFYVSIRRSSDQGSCSLVQKGYKNKGSMCRLFKIKIKQTELQCSNVEVIVHSECLSCLSSSSMEHQEGYIDVSVVPLKSFSGVGVGTSM